MRFLQFINLKGIRVISYKVIITVGVIFALISDGKTIINDLFGGKEDEPTEESLVSKRVDTSHIDNGDSLKIAIKQKPLRTSPKQTQTVTTATKKKAPIRVEHTYFNKAEVVLDENTLALYVKKRAVLDRKFSQKLSIELQNKNIQNSISFFNEQSLPYYGSFFTGNKAWLSKIKIDNYLNTYLVGELIEETTASTYDRDVTIIDISFSGKLINIKNNTSIPVVANANVSSYNKQEAFKEAYDTVVKDIVASIRSVM